MDAIDLQRVIRDVEDVLLPGLKLNVFERVLYHYLFRHTRLLGKEAGLFGLLSIAGAVGMSESSVRKHIRSMQQKGCIRIDARTKNGHVIRVFLPEEIPGLLPDNNATESVDIESVDFFTGRRYANALLLRENSRCFYCLREINLDTCVLDHVVARAHESNHTYRNVVASCHECNAVKQATDPADFLRSLYRRGLLSQVELADRLNTLERLQAGELIPDLGRESAEQGFSSRRAKDARG